MEIIIIIGSTALGGPWPPYCMEIGYNKGHPNSLINMENSLTPLNSKSLGGFSRNLHFLDNFYTKFHVNTRKSYSHLC